MQSLLSLIARPFCWYGTHSDCRISSLSGLIMSDLFRFVLFQSTGVGRMSCLGIVGWCEQLGHGNQPLIDSSKGFLGVQFHLWVDDITIHTILTYYHILIFYTSIMCAIFPIRLRGYDKFTMPGMPGRSEISLREWSRTCIGRLGGRWLAKKKRPGNLGNVLHPEALRTHQSIIKHLDEFDNYPLVICYIAIENGHSGFNH